MNLKFVSSIFVVFLFLAFILNVSAVPHPVEDEDGADPPETAKAPEEPKKENKFAKFANPKTYADKVKGFGS